MGIAENYLPKVVQKMQPKQLPMQLCVQCVECHAVLRAVVYADTRAEQYAEFCAVIREESFAEKIAPMQKPLHRLVRSPVRIEPLTMPTMAQWDYSCIILINLRHLERKIAQMQNNVPFSVQYLVQMLVQIFMQ